MVTVTKINYCSNNLPVQEFFSLECLYNRQILLYNLRPVELEVYMYRRFTSLSPITNI